MIVYIFAITFRGVSVRRRFQRMMLHVFSRAKSGRRLRQHTQMLVVAKHGRLMSKGALKSHSCRNPLHWKQGDEQAQNKLSKLIAHVVKVARYRFLAAPG